MMFQNIYAGVAFALLSLASFSFATNGTMAGSGTAEDPWQVADYEDLKAVGVDSYSMDGHYLLVADIDASASRFEKSETDSTEGFPPIGIQFYGLDIHKLHFGGVFDGGDHTISGLYSKAVDEHAVAMFYGLDSAAVVKNLRMTDCHFSARLNSAATLVFLNLKGVVDSVTFERDTVIGVSSTGGVVGDNSDGTVQNVDFNGVVLGINDREIIGGLVGSNMGEKAVIRNVKVNADMRSTYNGSYLGVVAGSNSGLIVSARVDGFLDHGDKIVGGVAGENSGIIDSCNSVVSIFSMNPGTGGLVGRNLGTIRNSNVEADSVFCEFRGAGGFVGINDSLAVIENSTVKTNVYSDSAGGFVVHNAGIIRNSHMEGTVAADTFPGISVSGFAVRNTGLILNSYTTANVDAFNRMAGFVVYNAGDIDSCYATGHVNNGERGSGDTYGGFVGLNESSGVITNSRATGEVVGGMQAGGFVGRNFGTIKNCYATGDVRSYSGFGGFAGWNDGKIFYCFATGNVQNLKTYDESYSAGGFVGDNRGYVNNAFATGNVSSEYTPGGFVSTNEGYVSNAYATGSVSGKIMVGGFVSSNKKNMENAFYTGKVTLFEGEAELYGCYAGDNNGEINNALYNKDSCGFETDSLASGVSLADLKKADTYKDWVDFDKYWVLRDTMAYPQLVFAEGVFAEVKDDPRMEIVKPAAKVATAGNSLKLSGSRKNMLANLTLSRSGNTQIKVYNLKGRLLKMVSLGELQAGHHQVLLPSLQETREIAVVVLFQGAKALSRAIVR